MNTIHLYGDLGTSFQPTLKLEVEDASEAIRALVNLFPGFNDEMKLGEFVLIADRTGNPDRLEDLTEALRDQDRQLDMEMTSLALGKSTLHIIPVMGGEGGRGLGKVLLGAALIAGAFMTGGAALAAGAQFGGSMGLGAAMASTTFLGISMSQFAVFGALMAVTGISSMLAKPPKAAKPVDENASFLFAGPENVFSQGNCVPVIYGGPIRVGSVAVSSGVSTDFTTFNGNIDTGTPGGSGGWVDDLITSVVDQVNANGPRQTNPWVGGGGGGGGENPDQV